MKTINPFNNTPTVIHVSELPPVENPSFFFGFNVGVAGKVPIINITIHLIFTSSDKKEKRIATYQSGYKIDGEGLVLEEHIYDCCKHAIAAMQMFVQYRKSGPAIPHELFLCPEREGFEDDLVSVAKRLNVLVGKKPLGPRG